jgi:nucleoside-diphosphate-sugar epimerase
MRVLVTGGIGNVGRRLVARLVQHEHQVKVLDRSQPVEIAGAEYAQCDITDFNSLRQQVIGQDGIIHLAAIPYPGGAPGHEIFRINCAGTYNVFEAAAQEGIRRVVCASSINALGFNYGIRSFPILYLPVDEQHPGCTTDPYSFSKLITEEIAAYYWRREGISSVCLRLPWVYEVNRELVEMGRQYAGFLQKAFADLLSLPLNEGREYIRRLVDKLNEQRALRLSEKPWDPHEFDEPPDFNPDDALMFGYSDFWAAVSADDSAQAFEKALLADLEGSHALYIAEEQNTAGVEAERLAQLFFPEVTARSRPLVGTEPLVSFDRARRLLGYEPEYLLGSHFDAEI